MEIEGADLDIYLENGKNFGISLNETQLAIIIKILGLHVSYDESGKSFNVYYYTGDTLNQKLSELYKQENKKESNN